MRISITVQRLQIVCEGSWDVSHVYQYVCSCVLAVMDIHRWWLNYLRASSWSFSSNIPSLRCTLWRKLVPWKPLPRPSKRTATTPKLLTSTSGQSMWNCSETDWLPGVPSLREREIERETSTFRVNRLNRNSRNMGRHEQKLPNVRSWDALFLSHMYSLKRVQVTAACNAAACLMCAAG